MSSGRRRWHQRLLDGLRHAFALDAAGGLTEDDRKLLATLAMGIVRRRMAMPALLFLRSVRPLSSLGSQAMVFLRPFMTAVFKADLYDRVAAILERRDGIDALVEAIEAQGPAEEGHTP